MPGLLLPNSLQAQISKELNQNLYDSSPTPLPPHPKETRGQPLLQEKKQCAWKFPHNRRRCHQHLCLLLFVLLPAWAAQQGSSYVLLVRSRQGRAGQHPQIRAASAPLLTHLGSWPQTHPRMAASITPAISVLQGSHPRSLIETIINILIYTKL